MSDTHFKDLFSNETALAQRVQEMAPAFTEELYSHIGHLEADYKKARKNRKIAGVLGVLLIVIVGVTQAAGELFVSSISGWSALVIVLVVIGVVVLLGKQAYKLYTSGSSAIFAFGQALNEQVFKKVFALFGVSGARIEPTFNVMTEGDESREEAMKQLKERLKKHGGLAISKEAQQVVGLLDHSELVTESRNQVHVDDMFSIDFAGRSLFVSELDLKHVTGSGKNRKTKKIFKGYFVSFDLPRTLEGKTFVSTEGDKKGFGHMSFWKAKTGDNIRETQLEWNQFEKLLHVATNNETEARYVLPPDFMADLYDWWQHKKQNIRLAFIANRMYILFPDKNIKLHETVPDLSQKHIEEYILSIAKPLMHVLHLVEDVAKAHRQ